MSDTDVATPTPDSGLTADESAYLKSGGQTELPLPDVAPKDKVSGADEPAPAPKPAPDPVEKVVPLATLQEERRERQARDREIRELRDRVTQYETRFRMVEDHLQRPQQPVPDPDQDPFGYTKHVGTKVNQLEQALSGYQQREQVSQVKANIVSTYKSDVDRFKSSAEGKDFGNAYEFLVQGRMAELTAAGVADPVSALQNDEIGIVMGALQAGASPAERIYAVAKARGYKANGAAAPDAADKLAKIEQGQNANKSLAGAGGSGADSGEMTAEALIKMPLADFDAWVNKNPAKARRLMGGK